MDTHLLLAPAGHGKTEAIVRRIRQVLAEQPLAPVMVIVPNGNQAIAFRRRLAAAGGALGVEVYTFNSLYAELLARAGEPMPLLPDPLRTRLLSEVVSGLTQQGKLPYYAGLRACPGFIDLLRNCIEELKRARIFPELFGIAVLGLGPRLEEIALVYSVYQAWLQRQQWADNEGRGWLAEVALEAMPHLCAGIRFLAVSGFDEFNPTQLGVLSGLAGRAAETVITLTGDPQRPQRRALGRFWRAQNALTGALGIAPEALPSESLLAPALARLEAQLFAEPLAEPVAASAAASGAAAAHEITFIEAQTPALEARAALRWLKTRLVQDDLAPDEVAILARNLEPYLAYIEESAAEFGIPLHIAGGLPLIDNPAIAALLDLLSLAVEDWPYRSLLEAWRGPYFDWTAVSEEITPAALALLDEAARQGRVLQGQAQWRAALDRLETSQPAEEEPGEGQAPPAEEEENRRRRCRALRTGFEAFVERLSPPGRGDVRQHVAFVEALIGNDPDLPMPAAFESSEGVRMLTCVRANQATGERDLAALRALKDVLRAMVLAETTIAGAEIDFAAFYAALRTAVEGACYTLPRQNGVMVASVLDGRGLAFQALALLGLAEGEFPRLEREDILLREHEREQLRRRGLALETRLHGDEVSFFYQAITRARRALLLTRPYLSDDGQPWEASPFWHEVRRLNPGAPLTRVRPEDPLDPLEAASPVEWRVAAREFDPFMKAGIEVLAARLRPRAAGVYEGEMAALAAAFGTHFGPTYEWSASRLESYGTCPFEFFVTYLLKLEARTPPEEGFDVRILGSMLHKILEDFYRARAAPERLPEMAAAVFADAPRVYGFRPTPLWEQQQDELLRTLQESVAALDEISPGYRPHSLEARFGFGAPALVLQGEAGEVRLHGYIDRVDIAPDGSLRVIDYKSGSTPIAFSQLQEGRRLQLPLYALAVSDALRLGPVGGGFYWHIQGSKASSLKLEKCEGGVEAAFALAAAHVGHHVLAIRSGHFEPRPPADGCPAYCPAITFCWRVKKGY